MQTVRPAAMRTSCWTSPPWIERALRPPERASLCHKVGIIDLCLQRPGLPLPRGGEPLRFLVDVMSGPDVSSTFSVSESIPRGALPMYAQLFTLFRQRIEQGVWEVGAQIPSLEALTQEFDVARGTVRQAIGLLESEGLVARHRGKGTFVLERPQSNVWYRIPLDWNAFMQGTPDIEFEVLETLADQLPTNPFHELGKLDGPYYFMRR